MATPFFLWELWLSHFATLLLSQIQPYSVFELILGVSFQFLFQDLARDAFALFR
jgi:hypothetical protein